MKLWLGRLLIFAVFFMNVQCALAFIFAPAAFAPGFEMTGPVGAAMVRGMGILFLMWNVPYAIAAWHPQKCRLSMIEAVIMQSIGLVGETAIFLGMPLQHEIARASIARFMAFDGAGLAALLAAAWITRSLKS